MKDEAEQSSDTTKREKTIEEIRLEVGAERLAATAELLATREPMPDEMRAIALKAQKRVRSRPITPLAAALPTEDARIGWANPYRDEDESLWHSLLMECFGTRIYAVAGAFLRQLKNLCPEILYEGERHHRRDERMLHQALALVADLKPRNTADAALAAQFVAIHFMMMKAGERSNMYASLDARTAGAMAGLSRASINTFNALRSGRGRKVTRQHIKVDRRTTYNDNRRVVVTPAGGLGKNGGQPDGTGKLRAREPGTRECGSSGPVQCEDQAGGKLPLLPSPRPEKVPNTRRS